MLRTTFRYTIFIWTVLTSLIECHNLTGTSGEIRQEKDSKEKLEIKRLFDGWLKQETKEGRFWAIDTCNPEYFTNHNFNGTIDDELGRPNDSDINFSFADLNDDGELDGLATFIPDQCDGGNGSMWSQFQIFFISDKNNYKIIDTLQVEKFSLTKFDSMGFYLLDSIATNKIFGKYCEFKDGDGHCCPHEQPVSFDFLNKKLIFIGNYITRK